MAKVTKVAKGLVRRSYVKLKTRPRGVKLEETMLTLQELADLRAKHTTTNEEGVETFDATAYDSELLQISQTKEGQIRSAERKAEREKMTKGRKTEDNEDTSKSAFDYAQITETITTAVNTATAPLQSELDELKAERERDNKAKQDASKIADFRKKAQAENVQDAVIEQFIAMGNVDGLETIDLTILPKKEPGFKGGNKPNNNQSNEDNNKTKDGKPKFGNLVR